MSRPSFSESNDRNWLLTPSDADHINDYHGAVAPLHLLPKIVPCLLSLHNAEFQGLWPMRTQAESQEVCEIYNLDSAVTHTPILLDCADTIL